MLKKVSPFGDDERKSRPHLAHLTEARAARAFYNNCHKAIERLQSRTQTPATRANAKQGKKTLFYYLSEFLKPYFVQPEPRKSLGREKKCGVFDYSAFFPVLTVR